MAKQKDEMTQIKIKIPQANGSVQLSSESSQANDPVHLNSESSQTNSSMQLNSETDPSRGRFPTKEVFGYLASIIMTLLAIIVAFRLNLPGGVIMSIIGALALMQAGLQLVMFMHVTEGKDGRANVINMLYSAFLAVVIVFGSIWILTSGHMAGH